MLNILKRHAQHPHLLKFWEAFNGTEAGVFLIFTRWQQTLKTYMHNHGQGGLPLDEARVLIWHMTLALHHCHRTCYVCHSDLHPQNVLVCKTEEQLRSCVADFGCARSLKPGASQPFAGSITAMPYRAPELFLHAPTSLKIDMWSLGCCAAEMVLGYVVFGASSQWGTLMRMFKLLGTPDETHWPGIRSPAQTDF
jgi:serine/threonine protein kinase